MSVYVDQLVAFEATGAEAQRVGAKHGHRWCHLLADTTEELIAFAKRLGLKPKWIQSAGTPKEHFDLVPTRRASAVRLGAIEIDRRRMVEIIQAKRAQTKAAANG